MFGLIAEAVIFISILAGVNFTGIHTYINNLKRSAFTKFMYKCAAYVAVPLITLQIVNSFANEFFGTRLDVRFCHLYSSCPTEPPAEPGSPPSLPPSNPIQPKPQPMTEVDITIVCRLALNPQNDDWSSGFEAQDYVREAVRRQRSIDDCRRIIGLPTLADQKKLDEIIRLEALTPQQLCQEAMGYNVDRWGENENNRIAIGVALSRDYTVEKCAMILGRNPNLAQPYNAVDPNPEAVPLPTGYIFNSKLNYANLRDRPGTGSYSRIIGKLQNNTKVILTGLSHAPDSGSEYCQVLTENGLEGFVSADLIRGNCNLNMEQLSYMSEIKSKEKMESLRILRDIAVIGLGILATKR